MGNLLSNSRGMDEEYVPPVAVCPGSFARVRGPGRRSRGAEEMGNQVTRQEVALQESTSKADQKPFVEVKDMQFLDLLPVDSNNGFFLNGVFLPEENLTHILSFLDAKDLLKVSLVCHNWFNMVRSHGVWFKKYKRRYRKHPKRLPWYIYYALLGTDHLDKNLIKNGNGELQFKFWRILKNYGDEFIVEKIPNGADPLPLDVEEFHGHTSCFATSYSECNKEQVIDLSSSPLLRYILDKFKPHIQVSEWVAGRFDCACDYGLACKLCTRNYNSSEEQADFRFGIVDFENDEFSDRDSDDQFDEDNSDTADEQSKPVMTEEVILHIQEASFSEEQWQGGKWKKIEMLVKDYPEGVVKLVFQHVGKDKQFWKGHYGSKMAGGVLKIVFDSIKEQ